MTRWGGLILTVTTFAVAAVLFVPLEPAHADLLGGLTDALDETVESTESVLHGSVEATTDVIDDTVGSTGTALDEPVDDLTDVVDATAGHLADTEDDASTAVQMTEAEPVGTTTISPAPTRVAVETTTSPPSAAFATTAEPIDSPSHEDRAAFAASRTDFRSVEGIHVSPNERVFSAESLTVLSAASGFTGPAIPEPLAVRSVLESSFYERLLDWLTSAGSGMGALLAGPLLALEIVIRALFSAGSGLVAPTSLLGAYLTQLMWRSRATGPITPSA